MMNQLDFFDTMFNTFCEYLEGKLKWSETKDKEWTDAVNVQLQENTRV